VIPAPRQLGDASVLCFTPIDHRHRHTGACRQLVAGVLQGAAAGLAICHFPGQVGFYLFGCDAEWNPVTDTWHETMEDALHQAEFEYEGVSRTWQKHS
jgi:hypothetical protein